MIITHRLFLILKYAFYVNKQFSETNCEEQTKLYLQSSITVIQKAIVLLVDQIDTLSLKKVVKIAL